MILLFYTLIALMPEGITADWFAMLQTEHTLRCSADYLLSENGGFLLRDRQPLAAVGSVPSDLPWRNGVVKDPLQSGIWGGGSWNTTTETGPFPDSLSFSRIGLIQNTNNRSRYFFELDRPLPGSTSGSFFIRRNDTLSVHSASLLSGNFLFNGTSWEGNRYGWGTWASWSPGSFSARAGFSRLNPGDRRPEMLAEYCAKAGSMEISAGLAGAYADSAFEYRAAGGLRLTAGNFTFSINSNIQNEEPGFWGGFTWAAGGLLFSALHSSPSEGQYFQSLAIRHEHFNIVSRLSHEPAVAADLKISQGIFRGKAAACWGFENDSLDLNCHGLLGLDWFKGRLEAGPRFNGTMDKDGNWAGTADAVMGFTLLPFSISAGMEDITSSLDRSWSFGITWAFTDIPPQVSEEDHNGR
ncbi:hypothetical protein CSA37_12650 [Candidatus Fermentibacteria bacterium]|nr:MAG: hypothetical protein CSA37_12650 [Candidatus Fermentibacteria bacterium]